MFQSLGLNVEFRNDSKNAWRKSSEENAYSVFQDRSAFHKNAIQAIPVLGEDYWVLEKEPIPAEMDIAKAVFDAELVKEGTSDRLFDKLSNKFIEPFEHEYAIEDFVLIILDEYLGKDDVLRPYSSFQMINHVLKQEPERQVIIWQTPEQALSENAQARLDKFDHEDAVSFSAASLDRLLCACSFVVSQNSLASVQAMLHEKPAITYGDFPFHHICRNPQRDQRFQKSFNRMHRDKPEYARYLCWLLEDQSLCVNDKNIEQKISVRIQDLGW